jgi:hypothetical protein
MEAPRETFHERRIRDLPWFFSDAAERFLDVRQDKTVECEEDMYDEGAAYPDICECSGGCVKCEVVGDEWDGDKKQGRVPCLSDRVTEQDEALEKSEERYGEG